MNLQRMIRDSAAPLIFTELYSESQLIVELSGCNFTVLVHSQLSSCGFTHCSLPAQVQTGTNRHSEL